MQTVKDLRKALRKPLPVFAHVRLSAYDDGEYTQIIKADLIHRISDLNDDGEVNFTIDENGIFIN